MGGVFELFGGNETRNDRLDNPTYGCSYVCIGIRHNVKWLISAGSAFWRIGNRHRHNCQPEYLVRHVSESSTGKRPASLSLR